MTDDNTTNDATEGEEPPGTAAEASGSVFKRAQHPVTTGGEPRDRGTSASSREIEGEVLERGRMGADVPETVRPKRKVGRREPLTEQAAEAREAMLSVPTDEEGTHMVPAEAFGIEHEPAQVDPREEKFAEFQVSLLFALGAIAAVAVCVAYVTVDPKAHLGRSMNVALGLGLAVATLAIGMGLILWAKKLLPHDKAVQERELHHSPEEEELLAEETFFRGATQMGLGNRKMLRRTLLGAVALLPVPVIFLFRDLGPLPGTRLRHTGWKKGKRLVDVETRLPYKLGDLEVGGIATVMPEGFTTPDQNALSPTMLIRFAPGQIKSKKEASWGVHNYVAYSKICTHAGCPISLFEHQTHNLLCPCHQSTFKMDENARVIFGPAARSLPQLRITLDKDGYFVATGDYDQPVGPSFWERG